MQHEVRQRPAQSQKLKEKEKRYLAAAENAVLKIKQEKINFLPACNTSYSM